MLKLVTLPPRVLLERYLLPLLLTLNLLQLLYYACIGYRYGLHSDSAVMNLLAQEMRETGNYFPRDWNYANGDLWVWLTHTPIALLLTFLPNTYALHGVSSVLTAGLVLLGAWCVGGMLGQSRLAKLLCMAVLAGGISHDMAENLYGQAAYGVLFYQACFLAWSGWGLLHAQGRARWRWGALFALLVLLAFWSNPQRAAVFYGLPLILATLALWFAPAADSVAGKKAGFAFAPLAAQRALLLLTILAAALVAGSALYVVCMRMVQHGSGLAPATWLSFDGMLRNLQATLHGLLQLLGGQPPAGAAVFTAKGAWSALRLLAALALMFLLPWALYRASSKPQRPAQLYFAVFALASAAVTLPIMLFTSLPDMAAPEASVRYLLIPLMCALLLLPGLAVDGFRWNRPSQSAGVVALLVLCLGAKQAYFIQDAPRYFKPGASGYSLMGADLERHGLRYGYATFWNAGAITVLSEQHVRVRQISVVNGLPVPVRHLSSNRWYRASTWQGESFLMLSDEEAATVDFAKMEMYLGKPSRIVPVHGRRAWVYPHNIAARLPMWDDQQPAPVRVPINAASQHRVGQLAGEPGSQRLEAAAGTAGNLHFGPYLTLEPGRYLVTFDIEAGGTGEAGRVDVTANGGNSVLLERALQGGAPRRVSVPLELRQRVTDLELRVWSNGNGAVALHGMELAAQPLK